MKVEDQQHFIALMTSIAELYNKKLSKPLLDIYWRCLEPYSLELIRTALKAHILHPDGGQFMPKPADILRMMQGDGETQALQAWTKVLQAIRLVGSYDSVVFDDPIIHLVIQDLGGWVTLCQQDSKSLVFVGKQFEKLYGGYLQKMPSRYPKHLTGQIGHQNTQLGDFPKTVRLIGDKVKALHLWKNGCDPAEYKRQYTGIDLRTTPITSLPSNSKTKVQPVEANNHSTLSIYLGETCREDQKTE